MKTSKKTFIFFLLAGLIASSCGKNNNSGNPGGLGGGYQVVDNGVDTSAFDKARTWFNNGQVENFQVPYFNQFPYGQVPAVGFTRATFNQNSSNNSNCNPVRIFGINLGTLCSTSSTNSGYSAPISGTVKKYCFQKNATNLLWAPDVQGQTNCNVGGSVYSKGNNSKLVEALSLSGVALYGAVEENGVYYIAVGPKTENTMYQQPTKVYVINANIHSMYNPVEIRHLENGNVTKVEANYEWIINN